MKNKPTILFHNNAVYIQIAVKDTAHLGNPFNHFYEQICKNLFKE
jgi:hypothetical protein